jgi:hypothetical protein
LDLWYPLRLSRRAREQLPDKTPGVIGRPSSMIPSKASRRSSTSALVARIRFMGLFDKRVMVLPKTSGAHWRTRFSGYRLRLMTLLPPAGSAALGRIFNLQLGRLAASALVLYAKCLPMPGTA